MGANRRFEEISARPVEEFGDLSIRGKQAPSPVAGVTPMTFEQRFKAEQQMEMFESRYVDTMASAALGDIGLTASIVGNETAKAKRLEQSPFIDVIVPYSVQPDASKLTVANNSNTLKIASTEQPKAPFPIDPKLEVKSLSPTEKPALESPKLAKKEASKKSTNIFQRFIDWVANLFGKKQKTYNDTSEDDEGIRSGKLESPEQRNAAAMKDCLKSLNDKLDKYRDLIENDTPTASLADVAELAKEREHYKRTELATVNKEMHEAQALMKEQHKKYFEALHNSIWLNKVPKWLKPIDYAGSAAGVTALGVMGAAVLFTLATGGAGAVLGAVAAVGSSAVYGVLVGIGGIAKGGVAIVNAFTRSASESYRATMEASRGEIEQLNFKMQEWMDGMTEGSRSISKMYEQLSNVQSYKTSTIRSIYS